MTVVTLDPFSGGVKAETRSTSDCDESDAAVGYSTVISTTPLAQPSRGQHMIKKITAVFALALAGLFIAPVAANASYVPGATIEVSGSVTPGGTSTVAFSAGAFQPGETVSFTLTGENASGATLAAVDSKSLEKTASSTGAVNLNVTLPSNATGSYTVTATGLTSQLIGTATLTVTAAGSGSGGGNDNDLADTGFDAPAFVVWGAAGAIALGAALIAVLVMVRRQRASLSA